MTLRHSHETIIESFDFNGAVVALVGCEDTIRCGRIGFAANNTDEPDVDEILAGYQRLGCSNCNGKFNPVRDGCISVNYLSGDKPNGVFFGELVKTVERPDGFDIHRIAAANICAF